MCQLTSRTQGQSYPDLASAPPTCLVPEGRSRSPLEELARPARAEAGFFRRWFCTMNPMKKIRQLPIREGRSFPKSGKCETRHSREHAMVLQFPLTSA